MRIAAYCRVSTQHEAQIDSLHNQELFFKQFAQKNNYNLVKIYADEGISGKQAKNRTQFLQMLKDAKEHLFDAVVVKDISRFARNTVDFLQAIRELKSENINVQFLATNQTILGDSEFILTIFSALAQEESANLSKRVKFGMNIAAQKGKVPTVIYGYDKIGKHELRINPQEAKVVQHIFDLYVNRGLGTRRIGFMLDNDNVPTKRNAGHWIPRTIRRIIMNPIYCGILENHKSQVVDFLTSTRKELPKDQHFFHEKPECKIISKDMWQKAQHIMAKRQELYHNKYINVQGHYSNRHLFSTLIKCEHCGYSFCRKQFYTKKSGYTTYWRCSGNNNRGVSFCPNNIDLNEQELITQLKQYLSNLIKDKAGFKEKVIQEVNKRFQAMPDAKQYDMAQAEKELKKINDKKEKYKVMFANNIISLDELKSKIAEFDKEKTDLECKLEKYKRLISHFQNKDKIIDGAMQDIDNFLNRDTKEWTNMDLRKIIENISVNKSGRVTFHLKLINL